MFTVCVRLIQWEWNYYFYYALLYMACIMPRRKRKLNKRISCSIDQELLDEIEWITDHFKYNRSALIRDLLTRWINSQDQTKREAAQRWHQQKRNEGIQNDLL